jgi:hypothetical protein
VVCSLVRTMLWLSLRCTRLLRGVTSCGQGVLTPEPMRKRWAVILCLRTPSLCAAPLADSPSALPAQAPAVLPPTCVQASCARLIPSVD